MPKNTSKKMVPDRLVSILKNFGKVSFENLGRKGKFEGETIRVSPSYGIKPLVERLKSWKPAKRADRFSGSLAGSPTAGRVFAKLGNHQGFPFIWNQNKNKKPAKAGF